MATTISIPLTTLTVGPHAFGPASVADNATLAVLTIDRTPANGFNSQPGSTSATIAVEQSDDGGTTWGQIGFTIFSGGIIVRRGTELDTNDLGVFLWPGTGRQVRAKVTIAGASVAVQGTLVIS